MTRRRKKCRTEITLIGILFESSLHKTCAKAVTSKVDFMDIIFKRVLQYRVNRRFEVSKLIEDYIAQKSPISYISNNVIDPVSLAVSTPESNE